MDDSALVGSFNDRATMFKGRTTIVRTVSADEPEPGPVAEAAAVLRGGGLVAFPTETVYGLAANALDATAVAGIFAAKGRPADNPTIVHVADASGARELAADWPETAERMAARFWPGPLTLVLPKRPHVPDIVTAGGSTVGIRVPAHAVALALLRSAGIPIAAPSANRSTRVSPTTAAHVLAGLQGRVELVLDAGPTPGGLESTVIDLTATPPRVLRPGLVSVGELESIVGRVEVSRAAVLSLREGPMRSPGMLEQHYAPRAELICVADGGATRVASLLAEGHMVGWLRSRGPSIQWRAGLHVIDMPEDAAGYSARLYAALHELDDAAVDRIVVDLPPLEERWLAVHDRLYRASTRRK